MHVNKKLKKETAENIWSFIFALVLFAATLILSGIVCAVIMACFGMQFTSYKGLIQFLISSMIMSCPMSMVTEFIPKILSYDLKWIPKWQAAILYLVLTTVGMAVGLLFISRYIKSVVVNKLSAGMVSGLFALCNCNKVMIDRPQNT